MRDRCGEVMANGKRCGNRAGHPGHHNSEEACAHHNERHRVNPEYRQKLYAQAKQWEADHPARAYLARRRRHRRETA